MSPTIPSDFVTSFLTNLPGTCYRCEINANWTMRFISDHIATLSGFPASDFIDDKIRSFESIIHPDDTQHVADAVSKGVANNEQYTIQYRIVTKSGSIKWVLERGHQTTDTEGRSMLDGFIIDISDRMKLVEDRKEAEAASEAKSRFLANLSHEIRTPLNGIVGMASLLANRSDQSVEDSRIIETISRSSEVLITVIDDILDFSKIEADEMKIHSRPFNPVETIRKALSDMTPQAEEKLLSVRFVAEETVPKSLSGDPVRISQIVSNLLSNAVKFTEQGGIAVKVGTTRDPESDKLRLRLSVTDTGIGISPEKRSLIFKPFSQVDNSLTRPHQGSGLGLALSRRFARLMGGELSLDETTDGQGSTFILELECVDIPSALTEETGASNDLNILLVDDNTVNREVAQAMLRALNRSPATVAENGREAINAVKVDPSINLILMDIQMPTMDGLTATRRIRAGAQSRHPVIIGVSGNAIESARAHCMDAGMDAFLPKPFTLSDFRSAIDQANAVLCETTAVA